MSKKKRLCSFESLFVQLMFYLFHNPRFADDIMLMASTPPQLSKMGSHGLHKSKKVHMEKHK